MRPKACIVGYIPVEQKEELMIILQSAGYEYCDNPETIDDVSTIFSYKYIKASGMLKLVNNDDHTHGVDTYEQAPKYIPVQSGEEKVLVDNGWSFLDPDESEPTVSEFNIEDDEYKPKWGHTTMTSDKSNSLILSTLGFNLQRLNSEEILSEANTKISYEQSREVLLKGKTDKPYVKLTNNGYDFSGSIVHLEEGLFTCAIGGNPLFTTNDLSPLTASSGWLSFTRVLSDDHFTLVYPENTDVIDQRIEVVDAKTGCHLGHYFKQDGFCINASALNFFPSSTSSQQSVNDHWNTNSNPISWLGVKSNNHNSISMQIIQRALQQNIQTHTILLGAGCFWHTESALRRLPGILDTKVGYSGGCVASPTYKDICDGDTGHAEVVKVIFDPEVCDPKKLMHCFLAMHDPTVIRPGKRAQKTGQYRSCVFTFDSYMEKIALDVISECSAELGKLLSTEVSRLDNESSLFWLAEDRHQLHNERRKISQNDKVVVDTKTLSFDEWLLEYAKRSSSIFGPNKQNPYFDSFDDGMARMMI